MSSGSLRLHASALASRCAASLDRRLSVLATARLYLCTDARRERGDLAEFADAALAGGVDIIQLRDKGSAGEQRFGPLEARDELAACEILADAARRHGALFAVNDRADIARAAGADVLHLGQGDLPLAVARDIVGADVLLGAVHPRAPRRPPPRRSAQPTTSVSAPAGPLPPNRVVRRPACRWSGPPPASAADKPWFAIGGIDEQRLPEVLDAGARRIVVVRAITAAADPRAAAQRLSSALAAAS